MHLVVGLGNPGRRYVATRHNVGFLVVDRLAHRAGDRVETKQFGAFVGKSLVGGAPCVLAKPQSYMNLSGQPTVSLRGYYKLDNEHVVVVHDEVDIPFGQVRVKRGGGAGGHNGVKDLVARLGADFVRIRVGVSRPPPEWDTADYVLSKWTDDEARELDAIVDRAADAVACVLREGTAAAMNQFNTRPKKDRKAEPATDAQASGTESGG